MLGDLDEQNMSIDRNVSWFGYIGLSKNSGTPKSSILIGFSVINHPFWGYHYFWKHTYREIWDYTTQFFRDSHKPL